MTSVGSGSLIIVALLMLYPALKAGDLVGTDLVQAVPLVASAALGHLLFGDFQLGLTASILIGSVPGVYLGARLSATAPSWLVRRAIAIVLLASALKLLEVPDRVVGIVLIAVLLASPFVWKQVRRTYTARIRRMQAEGVDAAGAPTAMRPASRSSPPPACDPERPFRPVASRRRGAAPPGSPRSPTSAGRTHGPLRCLGAACHRREVDVRRAVRCRRSARPHRRATRGWWALDLPDAVAGDDYAYRVTTADGATDPARPALALAAATASTAPPGSTTTAVSRGPTSAGAACRWPAASCTSCTSAPSPRRGRSTPRSTSSTTSSSSASTPSSSCRSTPSAARRGWGYDGVDLFAVHDPYGGPDGLKRFVDAAHARGLGVVMDVVYNHLGPAGNYLARFGPYFTDTHVTPWGAAVNLDAPGSDEVRAFVLDNARMWLRDFHIDGLRLDAVHALADERAIHLLEELAVAVEQLAAQTGRPLFLIAESDLNDPKLIRSREAGGYGLDAQWSDDVHHALWATLSGERQGYYVDFGPLAVLAKAMSGAFVHDGTYSTFRGRRHGRPATGVPAHRFVTFLQDHDQIGNRAIGDRASATLSDGLLQVGAALLLLSPFTPMLFMGEEWGARTPWQFFSDHAGELGEAVRTGPPRRVREPRLGDRGRPGPAGPGDVRALEARLVRAGGRPRRGAARLAPQAHPAPPRRAGPHRPRSRARPGHLRARREDPDQNGSWFVLRRGSVVVVANLASRPAGHPAPGDPGADAADLRARLRFRRRRRRIAGRVRGGAAALRLVRGDRRPSSTAER